MNSHPPQMDHLRELSVDAALDELSHEDAAEYARLKAMHPEFDADLTDRAIAASVAALLGAGESPPDSVRARLDADLDTHFGARPSHPSPASVLPARARRYGWGMWSGWIAAAASLLLAVGLWVQSTRDAPSPRPAEARALLLQSGSALVVWKWSAGGDPSGAQTTGDLVWDSERQVGYMRFVGLAPNDPRLEQYQLWIFDAERDERFPVDGGVFDVGAGGEVVVAIHAKLPVADPKLFAVTVEKAGGVVVSDRSRIAVLAKPG